MPAKTQLHFINRTMLLYGDRPMNGVTQRNIGTDKEQEKRRRRENVAEDNAGCRPKNI